VLRGEPTNVKGSQITNLKRGIYLVANKRSADECRNLIYSIRKCGCRLPIRVIPYGGDPLLADPSWVDVKIMSMNDFPAEGRAFVDELTRRIPSCPRGVLRRFLCWSGEFEEFLYSDNDVVALMNWEELFQYLDEYELVHADTEFTTNGRYNMRQPARFEELMGEGALELAVTAGHFLCRPQPRHASDLLEGLAWMEAHPEVPAWHDQALLHITITLAKWSTLNLCKPPLNWACPFAGRYPHLFDLIRTIQIERQPISHLHYAGGIGTGTHSIDELLSASLPPKDRNRKLLHTLLWEACGLGVIHRFFIRARRKAKCLTRSSN
jgi:hypothetical protein